MKEIIFFTIAFIVPFVYYRTAFVLARKMFDKPFKTKTGIQVHHLHYGLVFVFIGSIVLLFFGRNIFVVIFLGYGLGLIFDEFISSLQLPEDRQLGLEIYTKSFRSTLILFFTIIILLLIAGFIYS